MKGAQSISTRRAYGCAADLPRVGTGAVQRLRATARDEGARITAPRAGRCRPDAVLVGHIRRVLEASPFHGEGVPESVGEAAGRGGSAPRRSGCGG